MMLAVTLSGSISRAARPDCGHGQGSDKTRRKRHDGQATRLKGVAAAKLISHMQCAGQCWKRGERT